MKLHLHLGAHKTATTHFQNVLEANRHLYDGDIRSICAEEIRKNLRWANGRVDFETCGAYLEEIKRNAPTLIISEENLSGETKDVFNQLFLYSDLKKRLESFSPFTQDFDEIEIWFSIRSMDGFLPSIYCEALRHWPYNKFENVYSGSYTQIWLPVIETLRNHFPNSRINVMRYEDYMETLPLVIKRIFGTDDHWDYLNDERPRATMNHYAVQFMKPAHYFFSRFFPRSLSQTLSNFLDRRGIGHRFAPFTQHQIEEFLDIYSRDILAIKNLKNVFVY